VTSHGLKFGKDSIAVTYDPDMARKEFFKWRRLHGDDDREMYYAYHTRSKGADTSAPIGPWICTREGGKGPKQFNCYS
jgi:2-keto-4-pentenoate hydratase/2-oxohepta-3-ene-1,7-dioic acid hydratase in catechol pathway